MILTEAQRLIQETARDIATNTIKPQAASWERDHKIPKNILQELGKLGFLGMLIPEEYCGSNVGYVAYALAVEEIAAADGSCSTVVSLHNSVAALPILNFGTPEQKAQFLAPMAKGELIGAFCLTEAEAGSDAAAISTRAEAHDDYFIINGSKQFITYGKSADIAIVFAVTKNKDTAVTKNHNNKHQISAFIVPTNTKGYNVLKIEAKMGLDALETTSLAFDDLKIPKANLLGNLNEGYTIALSALEGGRIGIAAQSVGMARHAFSAALEYAKQRKTFGKLLIDHQAISFKLAEMDTNINAARALILHAAQLKEHGENAIKAASQAKLFASNIAEQVCRDAIQIFGGYGYLKDFIVEKIYRDVRATTIYEGSSEIQKMVIAKYF
jgi:alkylation response protein AidB-like acyl-CoA dehydrogenase